MKKIICCLTIFVCFNLFFSPVVLSKPKKLCSDVLESLGYKLLSYSFKKRGLVARERHTFNGDLFCYIDSGGNIHSIKDNKILIAEDGFYGQAALEERDKLDAAREFDIKLAKVKINQEYKTNLQVVRKKSRPEKWD